MRVRIVAACVLQDAGRERPLSIGDEFDVSPVLGRGLVQRGLAEQLLNGPPETKPQFVPETKRGRRRAG